MDGSFLDFLTPRNDSTVKLSFNVKCLTTEKLPICYASTLLKLFVAGIRGLALQNSSRVAIFRTCLGRKRPGVDEGVLAILGRSVQPLKVGTDGTEGCC